MPLHCCNLPVCVKCVSIPPHPTQTNDNGPLLFRYLARAASIFSSPSKFKSLERNVKLQRNRRRSAA